MALERCQDRFVYTVGRPGSERVELFSITVYGPAFDSSMPCFEIRQVHAHIEGKRTYLLKPFYASLRELEADLGRIDVSGVDEIRKEWRRQKKQQSCASA